MKLSWSHCVLKVRDIDAMVSFYGDVLGFRVADKGPPGPGGPSIVFMSGSSSDHHQIAFAATRGAISKPGDGELALLAGHGVFVLGSTVRAVHQRAVALEQRCQRAWHARAIANGPLETPLPQDYLDFMGGTDGNGFHGFWESAVRAEMRADPTLLEVTGSRD